MNAEIQTLKTRLVQLEQRCEQSERRYQNAARRLRVQAALAFCAVIGAIFVSPANRAALAQGYGTTLQQLLARMIVVEGKTQFMSADATARSTTFTGCNVLIQSGSGSTNDGGGTLRGVGNLIVGYNALRGVGDVRTGSHNIIVGDFHNYSSFGGLVGGEENTISSPYASVSGGFQNLASGVVASVSGGSDNTASGDFSWVSGGNRNTASSFASSASGGIGITQSNVDGWSAGGAGGAGAFHSP